MTAKVASVHFAPVKADRSIFGGLYDIKAAALGGEPLILEIEDKVQRDEGPVSTGPGGGRRQPLRYHVDGYEIAFDIVREWTETGRGMTPATHPGIWVVRERVPVLKSDGSGETLLDGFGKQVFRPATPEEIREMWDEDVRNNRAGDRAYAEWCFIDGNRMANNPNAIPLIPPNYKLAANHYGFQADWVKGGSALEVMNCPLCGKVVAKSAMVCPFCQQVVDLQRYATREAEKQAAVQAAIAAAAKRNEPPPLRGLRNVPPMRPDPVGAEV